MKAVVTGSIFAVAITISLVFHSCNQASSSTSSTDAETTSSSSTSALEIPKGELDYNIHVRPILSETCFHCHGPDSKSQKAGFAIHTFKNATAELIESPGKFGIVPGKPEESEVIRRLYTDDADELMPPSDSIHKLTEKQKKILTEWVRQGAKYKKHWAFIPPRKDLPKTQSTWANNEIDQFIAAKHTEKGLKPAKPATDPVWLRRVTHSLTGLPPTPQELDNFLEDNSADKKAIALDRLLASPRYGEHMAVAWMEAARYADTDGYQNDHERQNWPWREYVIKAFNENKGFDQFTIEQMAGDMLPNPTHEQIIATAFNRNHRQNSEGGALAEEFLVENVLDRVETVGTIYFGLTMSCARCHDHKYDPLSQKEVFQFSSYFNNIKEAPTKQGVQASPVIRSTSLFATAKHKEVDKELFSAQTAHKQATLKAQQRLKKANKKLKGHRLEQEIAKQPEVIAAKKSVDAANDKLRQLGGHTSASVMIMREAKGLTPTYLLERGQYQSPDKSEELTRTVPATLLGDHPAPKDRLELAKWIVSEHNPITARVIVNRIWMHHFGRGIVSTPEDFGSQAPYPTHPKLIDWLAVDFRESGWNLKRLHKMILLSATYGQSSKVTPEGLKADKVNQWLARGPRFRLSGYALRDQALFAGGLLHEQLGGPSVKPYQPDGLWNSMAHSPNIRYNQSKGNELYRRSLYTYWKRAVNPPRQLLFDGSGREVCSVSQKRTNTPLQALVLMNDPTFIEAARSLAQRILKTPKIEKKSILPTLYSYATGYKVSPKNLTILEDSYSQFSKHFQQSPAEAKELINIGASAPDPSLPVTKLAALTAVAHIILNTDEVLNIE